MSQSKLPGYILPAIPPGIILLSQYVRARIGSKPRPATTALHATLAGALVFSALMIPYMVLQHRIPWNITVIVPLILSVTIAAAVFVSLRKYGYPNLRFITLVPAVLAVGIAVRQGAPSLDATLSARAAAAALQKFDPHHLPLAVFVVSRETEFGLQFYRDQAFPRYERGEIPDGEHLVVAPEGREPDVARTAGNRKVTYLGNFAPQKLEFFYVAPRQ
jgi:hypothetical protein